MDSQRPGTTLNDATATKAEIMALLNAKDMIDIRKLAYDAAQPIMQILRRVRHLGKQIADREQWGQPTEIFRLELRANKLALRVMLRPESAAVLAEESDRSERF